MFLDDDDDDRVITTYQNINWKWRLWRSAARLDTLTTIMGYYPIMTLSNETINE